ncbi:MAG: hypothetical protein WKF79_00300 [Nocardioides sp.]
MPFLNDNTLDNGLAALKAAADRIYINSSEPATFAAATSGAALGNKALAAGGVFPSVIAAGAPTGRKLDSVAVTDGLVTGNGSATHYSVVTNASSRLEVAAALQAAQTVTLNNSFALASFAVRLPNTGG